MKKSNALQHRLFLSYIILLLWPVGSVYSALKRIEYGSFRLILSLVGFFLGYSMSIRANSDGSRIGQRFLDTVDLNFFGFTKLIGSIYTDNTLNPDLYLSTISFLISRVTDSTNFFFGVLGFVYFYFFFKFYARLQEYLSSHNLIIKENFLLITTLLGICLIYPFSAGINAVRFPLATFVFFYGIVSFILSKKNKYLFWICFTFLIHWSFLLLVLIFFLFFIFRKFNSLIYLNLLLLTTFVLSFTFLNNINQYADIAGTTIESKYDVYSNENYVTDRISHFSDLNLHIQLSKTLPYYFSIVLLIFTQLPLFKIKIGYNSKQMLIITYLVFIASFVLGSSIDPINNRFTKLTFMASMIYLVFLYVDNRDNRVIRNLMRIYIPIAFLQLYAVMRTDFEVFNVVTYFGNIFIFNFFDDLKPVIDLIT